MARHHGQKENKRHPNNLSNRKQKRTTATNNESPKPIDNRLIKQINDTQDVKQRFKILKTAWNYMPQILQPEDEHAKLMIHLMVKVMLDSMLMAGWEQLPKEEIDAMKDQIIELKPLLSRYPNALYRCKYIIENMEKPWQNETFQMIINPKYNTDERQIDEIGYFSKERGCMIELRAQKLIENKCDEFAIRFIKHALMSIRLCTDNHILRQTISNRQLQSLMDNHLSLLFKTNQIAKMKNELESMDLTTAKEYIENGFLMITHHNQHPNPLYKYHKIVSKYAVQFILVRMLNGCYAREEHPNHYEIRGTLFTIWIHQNKNETNFFTLFHQLLLTAKSKSTLYNCCQQIYEMYPNDGEFALKIIIIELNREINRLEVQMNNPASDLLEIINAERWLSKIFIFLANLFSGDPILKRECILTAFSLNPKPKNYDLVNSVRPDQTINNNKSPTSAIKSESLKIDLFSLINVCRMKQLSWDKPWSELKKECKDLLTTGRKEQIIKLTKAIAKENLAFLNRDSNQETFKNLKPYKYAGIERGYEHFALENISSDDDTLSAPESKTYIDKIVNKERRRYYGKNFSEVRKVLKRGKIDEETKQRKCYGKRRSDYGIVSQNKQNQSTLSHGTTSETEKQHPCNVTI